VDAPFRDPKSGGDLKLPSTVVRTTSQGDDSVDAKRPAVTSRSAQHHSSFNSKDMRRASGESLCAGQLQFSAEESVLSSLMFSVELCGSDENEFGMFEHVRSSNRIGRPLGLPVSTRCSSMASVLRDFVQF
jgi:hypothetical protein